MRTYLENWLSHISTAMFCSSFFKTCGDGHNTNAISKVKAELKEFLNSCYVYLTKYAGISRNSNQWWLGILFYFWFDLVFLHISRLLHSCPLSQSLYCFSPKVMNSGHCETQYWNTWTRDMILVFYNNK